VNRAKKAANPAKERDYPPDTGVELRCKEGEHSYAPASRGRRREQSRHGKLLEKVLDRENLNLAYKRVKKNVAVMGLME